MKARKLFPFFVFFLIAAVASSKTQKIAELLEKIEAQEAKLQQQEKLADLLAKVEKRIENVQKFQINSVRPIELRIEEAEQKLLGFEKLPELVSQMEARMETVVQLEVQNLLPLEERLNEAHKKLSVCSDIEEAVGKLEGCASKITQEEKVVERLQKLEKNVTSMQEDAASLIAFRNEVQAEMQIKIDLFTVQAQKISSLEARVQELETRQLKGSKLSDLLDLYHTRQAAINKLHVADIAALHEKLKKTEQKLLEYSSLPELIRQLEIRAKAQQASSLDRISALETQLRGGSKEGPKDEQLSALQKKLAIVEQTQWNSTHLIGELDRDLKDVIERRTLIISNLTSFHRELSRYEGLPNKMAELEKNFKNQVIAGFKNVSDQYLQLRKNLSELQQTQKDLSSQFDDNRKNASLLSDQYFQTRKTLSELQQIQNKLTSQFDDGKKSASALADQHLQLSKKVESLGQGQKGVEKQILSHQSQFQNMAKNPELEKKLTTQLNDVAKSVSSLTNRLPDLEKDVLGLKQGNVVARVSALEKANAVMINENKALNATIEQMMLDNTLQTGNITLGIFLTDLIQNDVMSLKQKDDSLEKRIQNDVANLKQKDQSLEKQLQNHDARLKSHKTDMSNATNKLKQVQDTVSRHDGLISSSVSAQNKNVADRLANLESDSLAGKKDRAILYDTIKQVTGDLRQNEAETKSQNKRLSSLNGQCSNLSLALKDLRAQVKFFHADFSLDNIVDATKRRSALHVAAMEGNVEQVEYLLRNGANAELEDYRKWRPIHLAAWQGHERVVRELLDSGVKVNPTDEFGYTPLHWAAQYGREACVDLLLNMGANIEARDMNDETPLHKAAWYEQIKMIELLLKRGAKINAYRKEKYTALHLAAQKGYLACVKALVKNGADVHAKTIDGYNALDLALSHRHQDVINYLNLHT